MLILFIIYTICVLLDFDQIIKKSTSIYIIPTMDFLIRNNKHHCKTKKIPRSAINLNTSLNQ